MGANINIIVQRYTAREVLLRDVHGDPTGVDVDDEWETVVQPPGAYGRQNYFLYDLLWGVRKGRAHGQGPLFPSRGMPSDLVEQFGSIDEAATAFVLGEHNFGWLTFEELFAINWDTEFEMEAWLDPLNFARAHFNRPPLQWFDARQLSSQPPVAGTELTREKMLELIASIGFTEEALQSPTQVAFDLNASVCRTKWTSTWRRHCGDFIDWVNGLKTTPMGYYPTEARIIYGFTS